MALVPPTQGATGVTLTPAMLPGSNPPPVTAGGSTPPVGSITNVAQATNAGAYDATHGTGAYQSYVVANKTAPSSVTVPPPPASDANSPSTSSYLQTTGQTTAATTSATTPTPPATPVTYTPALQAFKDANGFSDQQMSQYMSDPDSIVSITSDYNNTNQANADAAQAQAAEAESEAAANATADSNYGILVNKIQSANNAAIQKATGDAFAANPYAATGSGLGSATGAINGMYATMLQTANTDYEAAQQARLAGDATAYAKIMDDLDTKISGYADQLNSQLGTQASQEQTKSEQAATLQLNTQTKEQTLADKEAQTMPEATTDAVLNLPTTISGLDANGNPTGWTAAQISTLAQTPFATYIAAGLSPQDAMGAIVAAANGNKETAAQQKITNAQTDAQQRIELEGLRLQSGTNAANTINSIPVPSSTDPTAWTNYYLAVAAASSQSLTKPSSTTVGSLTTLGNSMSALTAIQGAISNLSNTNSISNTIASYFPQGASNVTSFSNAMTLISGQIDKALGTDSTTKLQSILSAKDTPTTRQAAFNYLSSIVAQNTVGTISAAARGQQNVSTYAPLITQAYNLTSTAASGSSTLTAGTVGTINGVSYSYNGSGDPSNISNWTKQ